MSVNHIELLPSLQEKKTINCKLEEQLCYYVFKYSFPGGALDLIHLKVPFRERIYPLTTEAEPMKNIIGQNPYCLQVKIIITELREGGC